MSLKWRPVTFTMEHICGNRSWNSSKESKIRTIPHTETSAGNSQEFCPCVIQRFLYNAPKGNFILNNP